MTIKERLNPTETQIAGFGIEVDPARAERIQRVAAWLSAIPSDAFEHAMSVLEDTIWDTEYRLSSNTGFPKRLTGSEQTMRASEEVLARDWSNPE